MGRTSEPLLDHRSRRSSTLLTRCMVLPFHAWLHGRFRTMTGDMLIDILRDRLKSSTLLAKGNHEILLAFSYYINKNSVPVYILSRATYPGVPSYGGVRTWVEGSQASKACKEYAQQDLSSLYLIFLPCIIPSRASGRGYKICPVCVSVCLSALSWLNRLSYGPKIWQEHCP